LTLAMLLSGCKKPPEPKPEPKPVPERVPEKPKGQSFVPPTAEQAYRLQDDCTRRGELVLKDNAIGLALSQGQVSRYSLTTNRCYVRPS
jgi:PBP1b-binding outer membrane lipoprotein LpoB